MDHITNLPSNLIDIILQRLPIEDVVRTSVLSRKWRLKWTSVPQLNFTYSFFDKCKNLDHHHVSTIITEILLLHNGPLNEFSLSIPESFPIKIESINKWILYLSRKKIKIIELWNLQLDPCQIPSYIFSCEGLTHLQLDNFNISRVPNFCSFKSLVDLQLVDVIFESGALESLMFGCTSLVVLSIVYCDGFECINVYSPTLEVLHVECNQVIPSICLEQAKNMTDISLIADNPGENFEIDTVSNLIKGLPKIENICLGKGYIQMFSTAGILPMSLQRPLNCLKSVELSGVDFNDTTELLFVISLLKSSPHLEKFFIKSDSTSVDVEPPQILEKSKYEGCSLSHLLNVRIRVYKPCKNTMDFIRFLLASSTSLELLTIYIVPDQQHYSIFNVIQELQQMARASKTSTIEIIDLSLD